MQRPSEFRLIDELFRPLADDPEVGLSLVDDAGRLRGHSGRDTVLTVDAIVEGVHYLPGDPPEEVARKLLRVNLSDLAAKGAKPVGYLLTAGLGLSQSLDWMRGFAEGLKADQQIFGLTLIGGDTVATPGPAFFSATLVGEVATGEMIHRKGAMAGDRIYVTGTIGEAGYGLDFARGERSADSVPEGVAAALARRYRRPEPRVAIGRKLTRIANAAIDVSDGLAADLTHLCEASGVGAEICIGDLFISSSLAALQGEADFAERVLSSGDDYEILFTARPDQEQSVATLAAESGVPITQIGQVHDAYRGIRFLDREHRPLSLAVTGYEHR